MTSPLMIAAWMAAPTATTSSGFTVMFGSLPPVRRRTRFCTAGMRVDPPTRITSSMSSAVTLASAMACCDRAEAALDEVGGDLVERRAHDRRHEVLRPAGVGGDERQVDLGLGHRRQLDLGLLGRLEQALQGLGVVAQVDAVVALELVGEVVDEPAVEVVAAEVRVTRRRPHLHDAVADVEDAHVERAAAEVEDQHGLVATSCPAVGERGRGRLVDDAQHLEAGDLARRPWSPGAGRR